jgi:hypothetical protein
MTCAINSELKLVTAFLWSAVPRCLEQAFSVKAYAIRFRGQDQRTLFLYGRPVIDRAAALLMPVFRARASDKDNPFVLTSAIVRELRLCTAFLRSAVPRCLDAVESRHPLLFFTDASPDGVLTVAGEGGMVIDSDSGTKVIFSEIAWRAFLPSLRLGTVRVIYSLEAFATAQAVKLWLGWPEFILVVDNDDSRACSLNLARPRKSVPLALEEFTRFQANKPCYRWLS